MVGWPPFIDYDTNEILMEQLLEARVQFDTPEFEHLSFEAKDFLSKLIQRDSS